MTVWLRTIIAGITLATIATIAPAQDSFPSRSVRILVPFPAGGAVDIVARTLGDELSKHWGQSVVIENKPGAGGILAEQALMQSPPDGYTLAVVATGHALNGHFYAKLPYDPFTDFTPISLIGSSPNMLLVRADSPYKSVGDVIAAARAAPGKLSYGHPGNGTSPHLLRARRPRAVRAAARAADRGRRRPQRRAAPRARAGPR